MICSSCRERHHGECRGGSWCDCQHHAAPGAPAPAEGPPAATRPDPDTAPPAEPQVNWRRQG
ncbi:hypothetical protein AGRA3207_001256 [Actinomadura graeca]|uniref:Uncharacterized protein n=1 Tax=Actinomadura graeca TaxID=2750812 RepID=A0ABX8QRZ1_9ACTN|nr:hypothetical protein [Actinomadura graeca]QXJ20527.1 hypothetical protein AGRA3207_001256 [Actinomadura graeca]